MTTTDGGGRRRWPARIVAALSVFVFAVVALVSGRVEAGMRRRVFIGALIPVAVGVALGSCVFRTDIAHATAASPAATAGNWTFVQVQRVNSLTLQFGTDTFATQNTFGGAFAGATVQNNLESALASSVADGSTSWLLEMRDLTDLSGTSNPSFNVGVFGTAVPANPGAGNPVTYDGTSDLDWWYLPDASELEPDGSAAQQLTATFAAKVFNAGPGPVTLATTFGGVPMSLDMSMTSLRAFAGESSAPLTSTNGLPPGHLPEENLPDSLTSFESMSSGKLAGRISARSLAETPIPASLVGTACSENYSSSNTVLDLLISGCRTLGIIQQVRPTQPDTVDPALGGGTYTFFTIDASKQVTGCKHNGATASLVDCLDAAAYSSYFQFTTNRVIDQLQVSVSPPPQVGLAPASLGFGDEPVGSTGAAQQLTITNTGDPGAEDLQLGQLATGGPDAGDFALGNDLCSNTSLSVGASCTVEVSFAPTQVMVRTASLSIPSNAASSPDIVALTGNGTSPTPPPTVGLSPSSVSFGDQVVAFASGPHTVTITNTARSGSQSLMLSPLSIGGVNPADFNLGNDTCSGASLAAGNRCTVDVRFAPTAAGARSASLVVPSNAASNTDTVALSGNGTAIPLADVRLAISGPGSAKRGVQITYVITVSNAGPSTAHNVVLTDPIDAGASLLGVSTTRGTCTVSGKSGTVSCSLGDLAGGGSVGSTVSVKLTAKVGSTIANLASAYSTANGAGPATHDPDTSNNWAALTTTVTK